VRRAALLLGCALLSLPACAKPAKPPPPLKLDCALGFETLSARIAADPSLHEAPQPPGEPYRYFNALDGATSYMITQAGAPGHPAILKQQATPAGPVNSGCPYGDRAGYEKLLAYLQSLAKGIVR
jgi:hypothetical protein